VSPASQCGQSARGVQPRDRSGGIFRDFDDLAHRHGLEKIKTIGAAYMAAGLPVPEADHVDRAVQMGVDMVAAIVPLRQEIGVS